MLLPLLKPHGLVVLGGLALIAVNYGCAVFQPYSLRYVVDSVIGQHCLALLWPIVGLLFAACIVQALTSYALNAMFARPGQEIIAALRRTLRNHIAGLPLSFYD